MVLGPFQGKIACVCIPVGKGVCGTAIAEDEDKVQRVDDVHAFPGRIACDAARNAEIVIPLKVKDAVVGTLDIDSTVFNRFDSEDESGLVALTDGLCEVLVDSNIDKFLQLTHS
nr:ProP effector [Candidatus Pantoea persica]